MTVINALSMTVINTLSQFAPYISLLDIL